VGGPYFWAFVVFSLLLHALEEYLEVRQLRKNRESEVPEELSSIVDSDKFLESQKYQVDKRCFGFVQDNLRFVWQMAQLFLISPLMWQFSLSVFGVDAEYKTTLFWLFLNQWVDKPLDIPLSLYSDFVIEARHGFNKKTVSLFFTDLVKSELLMYVFVAIIVPLLIWIVRYFGQSFYLYLWASCQVLMIAMLWVFPNVVQPLFNKFETLKDDDLREKIEALSAEVQFPCTKIFQIDGSKRSAHSNAYFIGFWKYKRIVLYDTLLHLKQEDILAILCHELGHWKFGHTLFNMAIVSVHMFILFYLYGLVMYSGDFSREIVREFGYKDSQAVFISLMVFMNLYSPTDKVLTLMMTNLSRRFEFQADSFAATMGRGDALCSGLFTIHEENKGDLNPDPWYSWYHFSHPPLVERLRAMKLQKESAQKKGQ